MKNARGAFSLIEVLIVLAIIGILVLIALPNFLQAQVRAKMTRSAAELRTLALALECYQADNGAYPMCNPYSLALTPAVWGPPVTLERLTTPCTYLSSVNTYDPFEPQARYHGPQLEDEALITEPDQRRAARVYKYAAQNATGYALWILLPSEPPACWYILEACGPDRHYHNLGDALRSMSGDDINADRRLSLKTFYDPTNGTISRGSLWRVGGDHAGRAQVFYECVSQRQGG